MLCWVNKRTAKCSPRTARLCRRFVRLSPPSRARTHRKLQKLNAAPPCRSIAETANAEEGLATSRQINSKTSITRCAAWYKSLSQGHCLFGRWLFLCRQKIFQNRLFKTRFSVRLNGGAFKNANDEATRKHFVNFCEKGSKKCVLAAYHMGGLFQKAANRQYRCRTVNVLWIISKELVKIAFPWPMQWGDFFVGTPLKTQKSVGLNRGSYCWT